MPLFLLLTVLFFLPLSPAFSGQGKMGEKEECFRILESLPRELPGGEFFRVRLKTGKNGASSLYRGPSGMLLNLELSRTKSPPLTLEKAHKEKLSYVKTLKDGKGKRVPCSWLLPRKQQTFPGLAGKSLSGIRMQARIGKGKEAGRLDVFLAVYRERLLEISFLLPEAAIPAKAQERIFSILLSRVAQILYEGEKVQLAPYLKKLFLEAFAKLMAEPEKAAMERGAINRFVEKSSFVIVRVDPGDFPWQKELVKKVPEGKKVFALLLSAYMGGNAAEQLKKGVCRDCREAGIRAMKKMYNTLRQKKILSMPIPELEK